MATAEAPIEMSVWVAPSAVLPAQLAFLSGRQLPELESQAGTPNLSLRVLDSQRTQADVIVLPRKAAVGFQPVVSD